MIVAKFTEAELNRALTRNSRALIRGKKPSEHPTAILLGGQSGAGKTTIHRIKQEAYQGISLSLMVTVFAHSILIFQRFSKNMVKIVWNTPKNLLA